MKCDVCPHLCFIPPGGTGLCQVRANDNGRIVNRQHGNCSVVTVESIEKRPFFHFSPGEKYLSVGFFGCSLDCDFCQTFKISQAESGKNRNFEPSELIDLAYQKGVHGIAFTYNEPTIHWEYICDVGRLKGNLKIVVKTNGYATIDTWLRLDEVVDGYNVDLKLEHLEECMDSICFLSEGKRVEVSYPVYKEHCDPSDHHNIWIRDHLPNVPLHLLYLYPFHRMVEQYDPGVLCQLLDFFKERLIFVYISNLHKSDFLSYRNTYCPVCNDLMVQREGKVLVHKKSCCGISI